MNIFLNTFLLSISLGFFTFFGSQELQAQSVSSELGNKIDFSLKFMGYDFPIPVLGCPSAQQSIFDNLDTTIKAIMLGRGDRQAVVLSEELIPDNSYLELNKWKNQGTLEVIRLVFQGPEFDIVNEDGIKAQYYINLAVSDGRMSELMDMISDKSNDIHLTFNKNCANEDIFLIDIPSDADLFGE